MKACTTKGVVHIRFLVYLRWCKRVPPGSDPDGTSSANPCLEGSAMSHGSHPVPPITPSDIARATAGAARLLGALLGRKGGK